ncbi:MAG: translation initiation factor IF-6 [Candidatus Micrarchaeota archaeon]|nr:translation initiation factor IF-6 [Candidatus Micrarchaeota archaeon]
MGVARLTIDGNSYVGAFGIATEKFALLGGAISAKKHETIEKDLGVAVISATIDNSHLVGIYTAANSKGVLLPFTSYHTEVEHIKKKLKEFDVTVLKSDMNALRNNILANDKIAVINPEYTRKEEVEIGDALDVEIVKREIGGFKTVGANNILTNTGLVLNNRVDDQEKEELESIFGMKSEQTTANLGSLNIGLCVMANSRGVVVGEQTTGFELARITNGLNL